MMKSARLALYLAAALLCAVQPLAAETVLIRNSQVFDGRDVLSDTDVLIHDHQIVKVGKDLPVPNGATVVDATGHTLLPGLIDAHTHSFDEALERSLLFGVTTVIDQFTDLGSLTRWRKEDEAGPPTKRADIISAGTLATAPGGHGTQYGFDIPTLTASDQAEDWVGDRLAEGSDFVKIVLEDGKLWGRPIPSLDPEVVAVLVRATHAHERLAVAHVSTLENARHALAAEVDGLVHLFRDEVGDAEWVAGMAARGVFVAPTLTVVESTTGKASGESLVEDQAIGPYLRASEATNLRMSFPVAKTASMDNAFATVRALHAAGVTLLAGTDAPNPGTTHGASMHRELELLVAAGLTPVEALASATAQPAEAYGLTDRGRILPGRRADLLLVEGDPTTDITATRRIAKIWKSGVELERTEPEEIASVGAELGLVSDFESGSPTAAHGSWAVSTDQMAGGGSIVEMNVVAEKDQQSLAVVGEIRSGFAFPWAGAMYFPAAVPMSPVDLSAGREIVFRVRSSGTTTLRLMGFATSLGRMPSQTTFTATPEWSTVVVPMSELRGLDPAGLTGLLWTGGPELGKFSFELDDVELR